MTTDPIWRPTTLYSDLVTWLDEALPTSVAVVDQVTPPAVRTPFVVVQPGPTRRAAAGMAGPNLLYLAFRAISVHDTAVQARALGDLVREALAGRTAGTGVWVHAMALTGCSVVERACEDDGYGDVVQDVPQWSEGFRILVQR
jgi:hypothetical protein